MTAKIVRIENGRAWIPSTSVPTAYTNPRMEYIGRFTRAELRGLEDVYSDLELQRSAKMDIRDLRRHGEKKFVVPQRDSWNTVPYALVYQETSRGVDIKYFSAVPDVFSKVVELAFHRHMRGS